MLALIVATEIWIIIFSERMLFCLSIEHDVMLLIIQISIATIKANI